MAVLTPDGSGRVDRWHEYAYPPGMIFVNERLANLLLHKLPQVTAAERWADIAWKLVSRGIMVVGFAGLIWRHWWAPILGFVIGFMLFRAALKTAADVVARAVKDHPALLIELMEAGVVR
jgi:hypothetical protein